MKNSILTKSQKLQHEFLVEYQGESCDLIVDIRYDDQCGNGHNSFSITGSLYKAGRRSDAATIVCGCIHDVIEALAPELAPLIKWHLFDANGPMHYGSNSLYHASSRDYRGLLAGETKQIINRKTGLPCWKHVCESLPEASVSSEKCPEDVSIIVKYVPNCWIGEGKEPDLDRARSSAVWPEAELADFTKENLEARLPALVTEFIEVVESLGFTY
jgi:hypothetical protein